MYIKIFLDIVNEEKGPPKCQNKTIAGEQKTFCNTLQDLVIDDINKLLKRGSFSYGIGGIHFFI